MCANLRTVAASNNRNHAQQSLLLLLARATYIMVLFFTHIPFMVNHTINAMPPERLQQHPLLCTTNHTDRTFFVWRLNSARPPHPGHSTILLMCLSLCNTQAWPVNLIHAILCNDEGITLDVSLCNTQARAVNLIPGILCDDEGVTQTCGC